MRGHFSPMTQGRRGFGESAGGRSMEHVVVMEERSAWQDASQWRDNRSFNVVRVREVIGGTKSTPFIYSRRQTAKAGLRQTVLCKRTDPRLKNACLVSAISCATVACNSSRTRRALIAVGEEPGRREVPGAAAHRQCVQRRPNPSMSVPRCRRWLAAAGAGVRLIWALTTRGQESARNEGRGGPARMRPAIAGAARVRACD